MKQTFEDLHKEHVFDLDRLAMHAGVPAVLVDKMIRNEEFDGYSAILVLQIVNGITGNIYRLENLDIRTSKLIVDKE